MTMLIIVFLMIVMLSKIGMLIMTMVMNVDLLEYDNVDHDDVYG